MEKTLKTRRPQFPKGTNEEVFQMLRADVRKIVADLEPKRKWEIKFKAILFPIVYFSLWIAAMIFGGDNKVIYYAGYFGMGLMVVVIFANVIHDAVHGTIFANKRWNDNFVYLFDLMGANSFIWRLRHIRFHHNYPNVNGWDTDIEQTEVFRVFQNGTISKYHKYQHIYMPFLYPLFLFNWLIARDFKDFFNKKKTVRKLIHIPTWEYVKLFVFKAFFFFYMIFFPKMILDISWGQALGGFVVMVMTASIFALAVLLPPHANTESDFPLPDESNYMPDNWFMHMLNTTNDVKEDNWFTRFFMGCFNYHVVHHLFPNVNHVYYPEITAKLQEYAYKHDLPYRKFPLIQALRNHFVLIRRNGSSDFNIWEETM